MAAPNRWWTPEEDALLREWYRRSIDTLVEKLPGRSRHAISLRAQRLGVTCRKWTDSEDDRIRQCYADYGARYCKRFMPDRTLQAICDRARKLRVRRDLTKRRMPLPDGDWLEALKLAINTPWRK